MPTPEIRANGPDAGAARPAVGPSLGLLPRRFGFRPFRAIRAKATLYVLTLLAVTV
jgi:hypothetical protein